jgi:ATP-binding cassette, subfamily C, bacterial LapB
MNRPFPQEPHLDLADPPLGLDNDDPVVDDPASGGRTDDPLAQAVAWLTRHHGRGRSARSLAAELPAHEQMGPDLALRALRDHGFNAGLLQRSVTDINPLLLPVVLLLKGGDACVLLRRHEDGQTFDVVMPGDGDHVVRGTATELASAYTGVCLAATPVARQKAHADDRDLVREPDSHWLWGTLKRFVPYYRSALVAAALSNVLMLATGLATSVIYDKVIPHQAFVTLWWLALGVGLAVAFDLMAKQLRAYLIDTAGRKVDILVGAKLFRQSLGIRMEARPGSAGAFAHQVSQVEMVREFFASASLAAISDLPFVIVFVAMTFVIGGPLGWVPALAVPILLGISLMIQAGLRRAMMSQMQQQADLHGVLVEAVEGLEDLKANNAQGRFLRHYEEAMVAASDAMLRSRRITAFTTNLSMAAQQVITIVMLVWGVYLIDAKAITAGAMMGGIMFAMRAVAPLSSIVMLATRYQGARAAMRNLDRLMAQPLDRDVHQTYVHKAHIDGQLALREVGFAYPAASEAETADASPTVLKGVNLTVSAGERVAILGRIGSGKSTILRLLAGLYQPTEGMVEVDGIDLRQIDPADYRAQTGFLAQDPRLFKGSLRDNVVLDRHAADAARLGEVAKLTGLDRIVSGHPKGWDMPVGEAGGMLSGGQRQLVALARCLLSRPRVILMDEPTSSMDAQSELVFVRQLKEAALGCTFIVVTHRPAVLELVDRIVVVDAGKIVMDGPKQGVLAALSGQKAVAAPGQSDSGKLIRHPSTQPVQREAAL